jgi:L-lysine exporter family protein LysE/ArgO
MTAGAAVPALQGFAMMLSLIVAIGAQNTFLFRQAIQRSYVTVLVLLFWLSDATLVLVGVSGVGAVVNRLPAVMILIKIGGAVVLFGYAAMALRRMIKGESLDVEGGKRLGLAAAIGTGLALTWLNPHVYLDTVLMIGAVANSHYGSARWWFAAGTLVASLAWFVALGYGARLLRPLFRRPIAWRILDSAIAVIMILVGVRLLLG